MRNSRRTDGAAVRVAALSMTVAATLSGCSDETGPLTVAGFGNVLDGAERPAYFTLEMCIEGDDPADITITDVTAIGLQGTRKPPEWGVAWADGPEFTRAMSSHGSLPEAYSDAIGAEGTIGECGEPDGYASLSVLFPPVGRRPVLVRDVEVTYEVDGESYTAAAGAFLAQCPAGTKAGPDIDDYQQLCRKIGTSR